jgi:hypothetical protein
VSAAWPYLFLVTTNGVIAYDVSDPTATSPRVVPVNGLPFLPDATMAIGRRVFFYAGLEGNGPTYSQSLAWVDVPQNPFLASLQASSVLLSTSETGIHNVLTNGQNGLFVAYNTTNLLPTANLIPPFADMGMYTAYPNLSLPNGAALLASSGSRLLSYRYDGTEQVPYFAIVNNAATSSALATAEQAGTFDADGGIVPQDSQAWFGTGTDGTILWETALFGEVEGGTNGLSTARLVWLLPGSKSAFDLTAHVDLVDYSPTASGVVVGPPAWISSNMALGLAAPSGSATNSTLVQVATMSPPKVQASPNALLPVSPNEVSIAVSNGFAYLFAATDPQNQSGTVYVIAPSCGATPSDAASD